jgi:hypothetical protein
LTRARSTALVGLVALVVAAAVAAMAPVRALAAGNPNCTSGAGCPDTYYTAHIAGSSGLQDWHSMGSLQPPSQNGSFGTNCAWGAQLCMVDGDASSGYGSTPGIAYQPSSYFVPTSFYNGTPTTGWPSPFGESDALALNGGGYTAYGMGCACFTTQTLGWDVCMWIDPQGANQDEVFFGTAFNAPGGQLVNNGIYASVGSAGYLVVMQYTTAGTVYSQQITFGQSFQGIWSYLCVGYDGTGHVTVRWPTGVSTSFAGSGTAPVWTGQPGSINGCLGFATSGGGNCVGLSSRVPVGFGNFDIYGLSDWTGASGTAGHTTINCTACIPYGGLGNGGGGGTSSSTCAQVGIISGASKTQWCPPVGGCAGFDTGWNIGADIQWLGCNLQNAIVTGVGWGVNALLDFAIPDWTLIQTQWNTTYNNLQTSVPTNYAVGALGIIPGAFAGAHSTAALSFDLPAPWSTHVTLNWSDYLGGLTPYRPLLVGLVYLGFATAVVTAGRRTFEN